MKRRRFIWFVSRVLRIPPNQIVITSDDVIKAIRHYHRLNGPLK